MITWYSGSTQQANIARMEYMEYTSVKVEALEGQFQGKITKSLEYHKIETVGNFLIF